jgi:hypothetical protein
MENFYVIICFTKVYQKVHFFVTNIVILRRRKNDALICSNINQTVNYGGAHYEKT